MTARELKASRTKSIIDWSAYTLIVGLIVSVLVNVQGHGLKLAGMEAWIRVAANTIGIPY